MLLLVSEVTIFGALDFGGIIRSWLYFLVFAAIGLFISLLYTGIFVILMEYHEAMDKFLYRYARLPPGLQHNCLCFCAYFYAVGAVMGYLFLLLLL